MDWSRIGSGLLVVTAGAAVVAGCTGPRSGTGGPAANGSTASGGSPSASAASTGAVLRAATQPSATARKAALTAPWPEPEVLPENLPLAVAAQAYDPATSTLYALPSNKPGASAQTLTAINVRTGATRRGAAYQAGDLGLADGRLWIHDNAGKHAHVDEIAPGTLAAVRAIPLPSGQAPFGTAEPAVAGAPDGSVWLGTRQTLLRVSASTGAVLATVTLPAGLAVTTMAADPDGRYLYVAATHEVSGNAVEGAVIIEYSANTGVLLASQDSAPISYSVVGAMLTAVPDGVWASFRTGMLGQSVLLSSRSLAVITAPTRPAAPTSAYYWAMSSSSAYGGGTLWVTASDGSLVACLNPATGQVIAQETIKSPMAQLRTLLVADPKTRELYATVIDGTFAALVSIKPPAACWR